MEEEATSPVAAPPPSSSGSLLSGSNKRKNKKKEEGKLRKRERIAASGGVRPRRQQPEQDEERPMASGAAASKGKGQKQHRPPSSASASPRDRNRNSSQHGTHSGTGGRFGRVMDSVPCRNRPRYSTLSIALPGSIVSTCQTLELKTQLVGQIARAATIYHVDEIVVYDDRLSKTHNSSNDRGYFRNQKRRQKDDNKDRQQQSKGPEEPSADKPQQQEQQPQQYKKSDDREFLARILQYCECPQYLRRHFFPMHPDLRVAGLLPPVDAPHHVRVDDRSRYREGVVLDKCSAPSKTNAFYGNSLVNCGIRGKPVEIDRKLTPGIRCTVQLEPAAYNTAPGASASARQIHGKVVSPASPRHDDGTYWGYTVRMADSLQQALDECPFPGIDGKNKYDLTIGTSERGHLSLDDFGSDGGGGNRDDSNGNGNAGVGVPEHRHALIVFGGVAGIEECVDADESLRLPGSMSHTLFDQWINICPYQGSRTIRTEEAVLISLAKLSPLLMAAAQQQQQAAGQGGSSENRKQRPPDKESGTANGSGASDSKKKSPAEAPPRVEFTDDEPSEESSSEEEEEE